MSQSGSAAKEPPDTSSEDFFEQARKTGKLDLADQGLCELPAAVLIETLRIIWLSGNQLTILPAAIQRWKNVQQLKLNANCLTALPAEIGKLRALTMLFVSDNKLVRIPGEIQGCKNLQVFDCRNNCLRRLPIEIGLLFNLYDFQYDGNPLDFPHRTVLKGGKNSILKYFKRFIDARRSGKLNLTNCSLSEVPHEVQYVGDALVELDISDLQNSKGISLPFALAHCANLKVLKLNPGQVIIFPPESVMNKGMKEILSFLARFGLANLEGVLDINKQDLSELPLRMFDEKHVQVESITALILRENKLTTLPSVISVYENLKVLDLSNNCLNAVPPNISKLRHLERLDISGNSVLEIPEFIARIPHLTEMRARDNKMLTISDNLVDLNSITRFDVGANSLTRLPQCVSVWTSLRELIVDRNQLASLMPKISRLELLEHLDLSYNCLSALPLELGQLTSLKALLLNGNAFREIPEGIGGLLRLEVLELQDCARLRWLPDSLSDIARFQCPLVTGLPGINRLILDSRYMESPPESAIAQGIPEIYDFLQFLRLARRTGDFYYIGRSLRVLPFTICFVDGLLHLELSRNELTQHSFPDEITGLSRLRLLGLDHNHLETLPDSIVSLTGLTALFLRGNPLVTLPVRCYMLASLQQMDFGLPAPNLRFPPKEISRKGGSAVVNFFRRFFSARNDGCLHLSRLSLSNVPEEVADLNNRVFKLSLAHNHLFSISAVIKLMYNLKVLRLQDNCLDQLPDEFEYLTALTDLDLEGNRMEFCPPIMSSLTSLTLLNMARNDISECPLPISSMTMLMELYLDHNRINALPIRMGRCARLIVLSLSHNQLTKLPSTVRDLTCLTHVNLAHNLFTIVPADLGLLVSLDFLDLSGNELESPPSQIIEMGTWAVSKYLEKINQMFVSGHVNLDSCKLTTIPLDVLSYDAIHTLVMTNNRLETLPDGIGRLRHLKSLDLAYNSITDLPAAIGECVSLEELNLIRNPMLRSLPLQFCKLLNLKFLDLDHESMVSPPEAVTRRGAKEVVRYISALQAGCTEGRADLRGFDLKEIPAEVMKMVALTDLHLGKNKLDSVPASIAKYKGLKTIILDENLRMRDLPQTMRLMTQLKEISLAGNNLKSVPDEVFRLTNLNALCFARNDLDGLGGLIGKLVMLQILDLSYNKLWTLPWAAMAFLKALRTLNLQGNPFTYISATIGQMTSLTSLNLSDTNLPSLPAEIVDLVNLRVVQLENVNLQGPALPVVAQGLEKITGFLSKMKLARYKMELELVDLECEGGTSCGLAPFQLSSVLQQLRFCRSTLHFVPQAVLDLTLLTALDLSENMLKLLPSTFGQCFPFLEIFIAQDNRISALPKSFGAFSALTELLLSKNALETLPYEISFCTALTHLDLSDNQITYLPKEAKKLTKLVNLDMVFRCLTDFQTLDLAWSMWGKPPSDITLQGGKVVKKFYRELLRVSGTSENLLDRLQGPQNTLNLSRYGLLRIPSQIFEKQMFSHLVTLDLSYNKIESLSPEISKLNKLQLIDLTGCPVKYVTPNLGALEADLKIDTTQIANVADPWIIKGKSGVIEYVKKAFIEINSGCMDFTSCGLTALPKDVSDLLGISELFLANNAFTVFPPSIGLLTNLTSLRAQNNKISCIPRDICLLTCLQRLSLQGNRIVILPTELGLLTSITELGYDSTTFLSIPREIQDGGTAKVLAFLLKLENSRGQQVSIRPPPGVRGGQTFDLYIKNQLFSVMVPRGYNHLSRKGFFTYLPDISNERRAAKVAEGFEFLNNTMVGLVLNLCDLGLRELQLMALPGNALDAVQEDLFVRSQPKPVESMGFFSVQHQSIGLNDYEITNDGIISFKTKLLPPQKESTESKETGGVFGKLITEQLEKIFEPKSQSDARIVDLPTNRYFTNDLVSVWMADQELHKIYPIPIGIATSLTELHLDNNKIKVIPSSIGTLSNLVVLSASSNRLESISWRLRYLHFLQDLDVSNNKLTELPPKIGRCERLEIVNLSLNLIKRLPVSIGRLTKLKVLIIDSNPIQSLPHEIGGVDNIDNMDIRGLVSLERISLCQCEDLRHLPSKLFRLTQIQELRLDGSFGLMTPPLEVCEMGMDLIYSFLRAVFNAEQTQSMIMCSSNLKQAPVILAESNTYLNEKQGKYQGMPLLKHLDLSKNVLSKLPEYLNVLTNLRTLVLDYNCIRRISAVIRNFTRLVTLSIRHNNLTGFCDEFSQLLSIQSVCADFNNIEVVGDSVARLSTLQVFSLENNVIRNVSSVILRLSNLKSLRLSSNKMNKLPEDIYKLAALEQLLVRDNLLTSLPETIGTMTALQELDVADNKIEILPLAIGKLTSLTKLETRRNGIIRPTKSTQAKGPKAVIEYLQRVDKAIASKLLNLENFGLTSFPLDVILLDLTELDVSGNSIATIPEEILLLTRVVTLRLAENNIQTLPIVIGRLSTIQTLDLHRNNLQTMPVTCKDMRCLLFLDLSENKFEIMPPVLETLTQIEHLNFTNNLLTRMPYWIGTFGNASAILFAGNQLCTMPNSIGALGPVILRTLNLSDNGLIKLPTAICAVITLTSLSLSGNSLQELPSSLGRLLSLSELWIDNNSLSRLPPTYPFWINLSILYAHNNNLNSIPGKFIELQSLRILTLSGNCIESIPDLSLLTNLEEIWLDNNNLATIPYFEKLPKLKSFSCKSNPLLDSHTDRAQKLMEKYFDLDVQKRMDQLKRQAVKVVDPTQNTPVVLRDVSKSQSVENKIKILEDQLKAALEAGEYESASEFQKELDCLSTIESENHYRPSSATQNFALCVYIMNCSNLKFSKNQDRRINPYV